MQTGRSLTKGAIPLPGERLREGLPLRPALPALPADRLREGLPGRTIVNGYRT